MTAPARIGEVQTVLGAIPVDALGIVLPHEHLTGVFGAPQNATGVPRLAEFADRLVSPETLWWVNTYPYLSRDNLRIDDLDAVAGELDHFRRAGGGTIVELTTRGLSPDPTALATLSRRTGVHVVAGTGWYVATHRGERFDSLSVEALADEMIRDIRDGFVGTEVRAGIIGELGVQGVGPHWAIEDASDLAEGDLRLLRAAAIAQRATGVAISIHPPKSDRPGVPHATLALAVLALLEEAGADPTRVVIGHLDRDVETGVSAILAIAARGATVEFDAWGLQGFTMSNILPYPSDQARVAASLTLIEAGFGDRLLWSHDVCEKRQWARFGAGGFVHLLGKMRDVFRHRGVGEETLDMVMRRNPARLLALAAPTG